MHVLREDRAEQLRPSRTESGSLRRQNTQRADQEPQSVSLLVSELHHIRSHARAQERAVRHDAAESRQNQKPATAEKSQEDLRYNGQDNDQARTSARVSLIVNSKSTFPLNLSLRRFESTVRLDEINDEIKLTGIISRISQYSKGCIKDSFIEKYCFCDPI